MLKLLVSVLPMGQRHKMIKTIGLDLDNTVFNSEPLYKMAFRDQKKYKYTPPKKWDIFECYPYPIAKKLFILFKSDEIYNMPLLDRIYPELIHSWQQKYNIKIITARTSSMPDVYFFGDIYRKKVSWVRKKTYEQIWNNGMYIPMDNIIQTDGYTKTTEIKNNNIDLMIDDSPTTIENCLKNNIDCIMISTNKTPYNHYLRSRVTWAKNLFEVNKIKQL